MTDAVDSAVTSRPGGPGPADEEPGAPLRLRVPDMDCASCLAKIRGRLDREEGVLAVRGSPVHRRLDLRIDPVRTDGDRVRRTLAELGYTAREEAPGVPSRWSLPIWSSRRARLAYASMALFVLGWILELAGPDARLFALPLHPVHVPDLAFLLAAAVGGWNFFPKALRSARARALDMNVLMTVAILGAVLIGEYVEGAAIAFLFSLAELLESYATERARASVEALMELAPETARVLRDGEEVTVPADDVVPGDRVVLRPGDRVPADGRVAEGRSAVDQSSVTGEGMPVEKGPGAEVFSGTVNREGWLVVEVTRPAAESTLARIVRLVEAAEGRKTESERFVDRFARWYTPAVTGAAVLLVVVPVLLLGAPFETWFVRGLTLLVIACPCALVISTPVAVVSGVTAAARRGVLIKGGRHLETLGAVRAVALDKTGTLTLGRPSVAAVRPEAGTEPRELLRLAVAVESRSEHPIAGAVVERAEAEGIETPGDVRDFGIEPGRGARAVVEGREVVVGKPAFAAPGASVPAGLAAGGHTVVAVSVDGRPVGWIALADRAREAAGDAVRGLRAGGVEHIVMLTGDAPGTAEPVGRAIGVDEVRAGLLPEEKVAAVRELEAEWGPVAMVGDGVNDAPALATASVGVVMGAAGSDAALETADVALMGDDLTRLPYVRSLSRTARRVIRQNIAAAIGVKVVLAVGVPLGWVSLIVAVLVGDMGVSLAVTLNALRLGRVSGEA